MAPRCRTLFIMFDYEIANTHLRVFRNGHCWRPRARETMALAPIEHESKLQRDNVAYETVPQRNIQFMSSLRIPVNGTVVVLRTVTFQLWCLDDFQWLLTVCCMITTCIMTYLQFCSSRTMKNQLRCSVVRNRLSLVKYNDVSQ